MTVHHADDASFDTLTAGAPLAIVELGAKHCAPCRALAPIFKRAASLHPDVVFVDVDVEDAPALSQRFGVRAMPTIVLLSRGEVVARRVGLLHPHQLTQLIEEAR